MRVSKEKARRIKFHRWVKIGPTPDGMVWIEMQWDSKRLSITGVQGPVSNGDCHGGCGQVINAVLEAARYAETHQTQTRIEPNKIRHLAAIWKEWHLNDMRAGCTHQESLGWHKVRLDDTKPANSYGDHGTGQPTWNLAMWAKPTEHPRGLMTKPCPICGYRMGTAWKQNEVPAGVIAFLWDLPHEDGPAGWA
jgi:hypothetical protein